MKRRFAKAKGEVKLETDATERVRLQLNRESQTLQDASKRLKAAQDKADVEVDKVRAAATSVKREASSNGSLSRTSNSTATRVAINEDSFSRVTSDASERRKKMMALVLGRAPDAADGPVLHV